MPDPQATSYGRMAVTDESQPGEFPTSSEILADIEHVVSYGIRLPGYPADSETEVWAAERFRELGLTDVTAEPVDLDTWDWGAASIELFRDGSSRPPLRISGFPLPYTDGCSDLVAEVCLFDETNPEAAAGRIAVEAIEMTQLPQSLMAHIAVDTYDPAGDFESHVQTLPFGERLNKVLDPAIEAGAIGYLGLLTGFDWDTDRYFVPYDTERRAISGMWVSRSRASEILRLLETGPDSDPVGGPLLGRLHVEGARRRVRCANVIGRLPGPGDRTIIVGSHHDAPWASAVEDASGIALVLAQAKYWASVAEEMRPGPMMFLLTAGHMSGGAGTRAFVEQHGDELERVGLAVHLEHVACEAVGDGESLIATDRPEPRWWFTSDAPGLRQAVGDAIRRESLGRSLVLEPEVFGAAPPTDGAALYLAGVPVVQLLAAPAYLFDEADTLDKIHVASLEPITRAVARVIAWVEQPASG